MDNLQISTEKLRADSAIINLKGPTLDISNYAELQKVMNSFFDLKVYKIIVEMSGLGYMSSAGALVFIDALGVTRERDGALVLVNPQPRVKTILEILRLTEYCRLVNNREEALKVLKIEANP